MSQSNSETTHRDFEQTMTMNAAPDAIYDFVADIRNFPKYMPTTKNAEPQEGDRVRVQGAAHGHEYDAAGYLRRNTGNNRLEWGADEGYYSGSLEASPDGDGSKVTVKISFRGAPPGSDPDQAPPPAEVQDALVKALQSIQNYVEGDGGKVKPQAEKDSE